MKNAQSMPARTHTHQLPGSHNNAGLGRCVEWLKSTFGYKVILEDWPEKHGRSTILDTMAGFKRTITVLLQHANMDPSRIKSPRKSDGR
jgi:hypothetical protein